MSKRKTIQEVINNFISVHGNKYDYSLINEYQSSKDKLPIICHEKDENGNEHGIFYQDYSKHYGRKHGCPKCAKNGVQYSQEDFEKKIKNIFGDKYSMAGSKYVNAHTPIKFVCKEHGEFTTKPYYLFQGHGCPLCGRIIVSEKMKFTKDEILEKFKKVHKDKYDYSKFEYNGYDEKSMFICHKKNKFGKEHGLFYQTPHSHIQGQGCPKCNMSRLENEISIFLEENNIEYEPQKKFVWLKEQKLDFFLPKQNIAIECNGYQHYKPCNFGSKKTSENEMFLYVCKNDAKKRKRCAENGIKILYFTHREEGKRRKNTFLDKDKLLKKILEC